MGPRIIRIVHPRDEGRCIIECGAVMLQLSMACAPVIEIWFEALFAASHEPAIHIHHELRYERRTLLSWSPSSRQETLAVVPSRVRDICMYTPRKLITPLIARSASSAGATQRYNRITAPSAGPNDLRLVCPTTFTIRHSLDCVVALLAA